MRLEKIQLPDNLYDADSTTVEALKIYTEAIEKHDPDDLNEVEATIDQFEDAHAFVIVDDNEEVCGVANFLPEAQEAWLSGLAVSKEARNRGVGSFALRQLIQLAVDDGYTTMSLRALPEAVGFWQRQGFIVTKETGDEPVMSLELNSKTTT